MANSDFGKSADLLEAGNNKYKQEDYQGAIANYNEAIRLDPQPTTAEISAIVNQETIRRRLPIIMKQFVSILNLQTYTTTEVRATTI